MEREHADNFKRMKAKDGQPPPGGRQPHANDNTPFDEKEWRRKYMRPYMRKWRAKRRERLREAKETK